MRIVVARESGFCSGVRHAIVATERALQTRGVVVATDTLLHNTEEMVRLCSMGLKMASTISSESITRATVLLPAHGSMVAEHADWERRAREVWDLTCPIVNRAHGAAKRFAERGLPVIVVGDKEHRETRYLMEAAGSQLMAVVESERDLDALTIGSSRVGVVYQTTQSREFRLRILEWFRKAGVEVSEEMTLCPEVLRRQDEAMAIAKQCSVMLVLGDRSSANTKRLAVVAAEECHRTYLVSDPSEVLELGLTCSDIVGIVGGTSCPETVIEEVLKRVRNICSDASIEGNLLPDS
ncbi:MAG: 4-hydroxy-3-methylbut-2-enyl diphosphate reductase [Candidatus Cryosericum sp.]